MFTENMFTVLMCQWFAPTKFVITFERDGLGRFTEKEIEELVVRDEKGKIVQLKLPQKTVLIANHQVRHIISRVGHC